MKRLTTAVAILASASALVTGTALLAQNWGATVAETDQGHLLGNPEAKVKIVEFMSYTCSHCARFAQTGEGAIKLALVPTGDFSFEIRHHLRDPIDLTAAMLAHCGDPKKFPGNHTAIMSKYNVWMGKVQSATQAQVSRWQFGTHASRRQAIASDLDFYDIMEARGYSRPQLDRCLADDVKANAMADKSEADALEFGVRSTPSFMVDGELLDGVHGWDTLEPVLRAKDLAKD